MLDARLTVGAEAGHPEAYVQVDFFDDAPTPPAGFDLGDVGLQLVPAAVGGAGLRRRPPWTLPRRQPVRLGDRPAPAAARRRDRRSIRTSGACVFGVGNVAQRMRWSTPGPALRAADLRELHLRRRRAGRRAPGRARCSRRPTAPVRAAAGRARCRAAPLQDALDDLDAATRPVVDRDRRQPRASRRPRGAARHGHRRRLSLRLAQSLTIRAADEHRPIVLLAQPLAFRPVDAADATTQTPVVRLEGLYLAPDPAAFPAGAALIDARRRRAARDRSAARWIRAATRCATARARRWQPALRLANGYGFDGPADGDAFVPTPDIVIQRSITGCARDRRPLSPRHRGQHRRRRPRRRRSAGRPLAIGAATDPADRAGARRSTSRA